ncbi:MAG: M56 family metallopeptidase, partial [Traorella sp.]
QSMIWSIIGSFHWCNPWIRHVIKVIKNDIEVLCDQRVLEKLDGEERRDYGKILLEMCNDFYADAFLTTSISNGTKQIKKRIESIVRFKKYPQGLSLVSICIMICLTPIAFRSDIYADFINDSSNHYDSWLRNEYQQANANMVECQSVAGAIDTFVKGIAQQNDYYLLAVTPNHLKENFDEYIEKLSFEFEDIQYYVINLQEINPNIFKCVLILEEYKGYDEHAVEVKKYEYIPLEITYEKGYKIEYQNITTFDYQMINTFIRSNTQQDDIVICEKTTKMETGDLSIRYFNIIYPKQEVVHSNIWFSENGLLVNKADIQADFDRYMYYADITYHTDLKGYQQIGFKAKFYEEKPYDTDIKISSNETGEINISTSDNEVLSYYEANEKWDGIIRNTLDIMVEHVIQGQSAVKVQIVADGQMIEEIIVEVGV